MSEKQRILVVDDEPNIRRILQVAFEKAGYVADVAEDARTALEMFSVQRPDCIVTDVTMPGMTGYELLREIRSRDADVPIIIMTAFGTIPQAVQAIRDGAYEYVTKPFDLDSLKRIVASALKPVAKTKATKRSEKTTKTFIAESPAMKLVFETVRQVADSRATVLVTGESGVGKEVVARSLHDLSPRLKQPYVAVSCAALPESLLESELFGYEKGAFTGAAGSKLGRFELADQGTLFLDEIGDIPATIQVKLLRVLQEREFERLGASKPTKVDVRLITATNRDLREAVDAGEFRMDLLYRLQVVEIHIPALRERREDILPLAQHFLARFAVENQRSPLEIAPEAVEMLLAYHWPGNVRELENTMERAVVLAGKEQVLLNVGLLPPNMRRAA